MLQIETYTAAIYCSRSVPLFPIYQMRVKVCGGGEVMTTDIQLCGLYDVTLTLLHEHGALRPDCLRVMTKLIDWPFEGGKESCNKMYVPPIIRETICPSTGIGYAKNYLRRWFGIRRRFLLFVCGAIAFFLLSSFFLSCFFLFILSCKANFSFSLVCLLLRPDCAVKPLTRGNAIYVHATYHSIENLSFYTNMQFKRWPS